MRYKWIEKPLKSLVTFDAAQIKRTANLILIWKTYPDAFAYLRISITFRRTWSTCFWADFAWSEFRLINDCVPSLDDTSISRFQSVEIKWFHTFFPAGYFKTPKGSATFYYTFFQTANSPHHFIVNSRNCWVNLIVLNGLRYQSGWKQPKMILHT